MLLREKDKQALIQIFSSAGLPIEVWAYGSRVNATAHEGSDLDLVIRGEHLARIPFESFSKLRDKIADSNIPILVELRDWARLPESFHRNIIQQYEVLFDNREQFEKSMNHLILNEPTTDYNLNTGSV